ncbi:MAG: hypothetical protein GWN86_00455, partial [Desulfobacterales bacterium]|nr:hypothetical protein [Desulfobacterales bacterium]
MSEKSKDKLECDVKFVRMDPMKIAMKSLKRAEAMADSIPDDIQEAIDK